jgi:hypothetical protein
MYTKGIKNLPQPQFSYDQRVQWDENDFTVGTGHVVLVCHDCLGNPTSMYMVQPDDGSGLTHRSIRSHNLRPESNEVLVW